MNHKEKNTIDFLEGLDYETGKPVRLKITGGKIADVTFLPGAGSNLPILAPGLVDLQVNGYGGIDFNDTSLSIQDVYKVVQLLAEQGITTFFPTLITNTEEAIHNLLSTIVKACETYPLVEAAIGGIHLEGPFLSPEDGSRGAHSKQLIRQPDRQLFLRWHSSAKGKIKLITLSPEWENAAEFISQCVNDGVIVSIGHTSASPEQIQAAVKAGARLSTHLGNGAHLILPRHPNYIWEQLAQDRLYVSVIADGFHLPDSFLKVVFKVKSGASILISDSTSFAGLAPGTYKSHIGGDVKLDKEGRLFMTNQPDLLAGSAQSLPWCIYKVLRMNILSLKDVWDMASLKPREVLAGKSQSAFKPGDPADLVRFVIDKSGLAILQTIKNGTVIHSDI
jgi:N-acetylglucosamine-6-phosphate deacetylase